MGLEEGHTALRARCGTHWSKWVFWAPLHVCTGLQNWAQVRGRLPWTRLQTVSQATEAAHPDLQLGDSICPDCCTMPQSPGVQG